MEMDKLEEANKLIKIIRDIKDRIEWLDKCDKINFGSFYIPKGNPKFDVIINIVKCYYESNLYDFEKRFNKL